MCAGPAAPAPEVEVLASDCFTFTKKGRRVDKTQSCVVEFAGDTLTVTDSGGVDDTIQWTVRARDAAGNVGQATCEVVVVQP